jgi:hypothetical protein
MSTCHDPQRRPDGSHLPLLSLQQLVDENLHIKSFYRLIAAKSFLCNQSKQDEMGKAYSTHSKAIGQMKHKPENLKGAWSVADLGA